MELQNRTLEELRISALKELDITLMMMLTCSNESYRKINSLYNNFLGALNMVYSLQIISLDDFRHYMDLAVESCS